MLQYNYMNCCVIEDLKFAYANFFRTYQYQSPVQRQRFYRDGLLPVWYLAAKAYVHSVYVRGSSLVPKPVLHVQWNQQPSHFFLNVTLNYVIFPSCEIQERLIYTWM